MLSSSTVVLSALGRKRPQAKPASIQPHQHFPLCRIPLRHHPALSDAADIQAPLIFGAKTYSAKESDSILRDSRMRAMREFRYEDEKRLFSSIT